MNNQHVYSNVVEHLETFSKNKNNLEWFTELNSIIEQHSVKPMLRLNFAQAYSKNENLLKSIAEYIDSLIKSITPKNSILAAKILANEKLVNIKTTYISIVGHCIRPDHFLIVKNWSFKADYYSPYSFKIDGAGVLDVNQYLLLMAIMNSTPMHEGYSFENLSERLSKEAKQTQDYMWKRTPLKYLNQNQSLANDKYFKSILEKFKNALNSNLTLDNFLNNIPVAIPTKDIQKITQETKTKPTYRKIDEKNWIDIESPLEVLEGNEKKVIRLIRERNSTLPTKIKEKRFRTEGKLLCEVCEFDFYKFYGEIGKEFIEAHHNKELSQLQEQKLMSEEDINLICANCHRMIHTTKPCLTVEELKEVIKKA